MTIGADARIARAGHWLRRQKLDELPQLVDVLRGNTSRVGPRPEMPRYVARHPARVRDKVLSVRPGITDMASIAYRHESALLARAGDPECEYIEAVMPRKLAYAVRYVDEASLWLDVRLLWRTLAALFQMKG